MSATSRVLIPLARRAGIAVIAGAVFSIGLYAAIQALFPGPAPCDAGCITDGSAVINSESGIEYDIQQANDQVDSGSPYATIVLLDPLTFSPSGTTSQDRITAELRGAYRAQIAANSRKGEPPIKLLIANEGTSSEEGAVRAVQQIESLEKKDHIVAVAGMGLSAASTETAASILSADGMPMFGAVTTGDQFNAANYPGFYQVVPDVDAQVQQLYKKLLAMKMRPDALISSDQSADVYSTDLKSDFEATFGWPVPSGSTVPQGYYFFTPAKADLQFSTITTTICSAKGQSSQKSVFYAGREAELPSLIQQFQQSAACRNQSISIVTGSDANALPAAATVASPGNPGATVAVEYSDHEPTTNLSSSFKNGYFWPPPAEPKNIQECPNYRYPPWAVATYNAVMAAAGSLRPDYPGPPSKEMVFTAAENMQTSAPYSGANDTNFGFNSKGQIAGFDNGQIIPPPIPVYKVSQGVCSSL